jgi:hypothetical protein
VSPRAPQTADEKVDQLLQDVATVKADQRWMKWVMIVMGALNAPALISSSLPVPATLLLNLF